MGRSQRLRADRILHVPASHRRKQLAMSQIDEAFIQAYTTPRQPTALAGPGQVPVSPPLAGLHGGPHIPMQPVAAPHAAVPQQPVPQQVVFQQQQQAVPQQMMPQQPVAVPQQPVVARPAWAPEPIPAPHFHVAHTGAQPVPAVAPVQAAPTGGVAKERRPLSAFSAPTGPSATVFNPVFEVDSFRWPAITNDLLNAYHELFIPVAEQLVDVSEQGRSLVGVTGTRTNVGCSTILMCLARLVGSIGKSVALVDANFSKASLARDLGFQFDAGWEDVLTGNLPLAECVVKSLNDRMALLPLARPNANASHLLNTIQTSVTAGVLRYHYDLVLFNLGDAAVAPQNYAAQSVMQHCRLDASLIIADTERTGIDPMEGLMALLGTTCLGVIGNSAS